MRFAVSHLYAVAIFGAYGWLIYTAFKARAPVILVCSFFIGAFFMRAGTGPVFDWGGGHRRWDASCRYALITGAILVAAAVWATIWLRPPVS